MEDLLENYNLKIIGRICFTFIICCAILLFFHFTNKEGGTADIVLIKTIPVNNPIFIEGLEYEKKENRLIAGTGLYGKSSLAHYDKASKNWEIDFLLPDNEFGEGVTVQDGNLWQLTWKNGIAYQRSIHDFHVLRTFHYPGEGWGLAYSKDSDCLIMSDGSSQLQIRSAIDFGLIKTIAITENDLEVAFLNELEYVDGYLYANIWQTNDIVKIDISTGKVVKRYNFTFLVDTLKEDVDVLNGIAHIKDNYFYISGKFYPLIWEVQLN